MPGQNPIRAQDHGGAAGNLATCALRLFDVTAATRWSAGPWKGHRHPRPYLMILKRPCLQVWRRVRLCVAGQAMSDEALVDVAPSPPRSRLQAGGQRVVGFLVVCPGVLAG
jgi:hypothetical protein